MRTAGRTSGAQSASRLGAVVQGLALEAERNGRRSQVYRFAHYDVKNGRLYVYDLARHIYRFEPDGNGPTALENGSDGVLFVCNTQWEPFTLPEDVEEASETTAERLLEGFHVANGENRADCESNTY